jgi:DNA-directed RNA polymerase omega subunit
MQHYKKLSRSPDVDIDQCVKNVGDNRFDLVLIAAARSKEIARRHKLSEDTTHINAPINALLEIQEGKIGREYLKKI